MSDPVYAPRACDIVANHILKIAQVLTKAKLNKEINLALLFDICTVVFVCFHAFPSTKSFIISPYTNTIIISCLHFLLSSLLLLCVHAAIDSSSTTMLM
jgi:hypothetical protein